MPTDAAERAAVGACMTMRSWRGSGGLCAVLAMRDGGGGKLWMFEASLGVFGGLEGFELAVLGGERW